MKNEQQQRVSAPFFRDFGVILLLCLALKLIEEFIVFDAGKSLSTLTSAKRATVILLWLQGSVIYALACTWVYRHTMRFKYSAMLFAWASVLIAVSWSGFLIWNLSKLGQLPSPRGLLVAESSITTLGYISALFTPFAFMALYSVGILIYSPKSHKSMR